MYQSNFNHNPYVQVQSQQTVSNPSVPYEGDISNGVQPGKQIRVSGNFPHHANRCQFDLKTYSGTAMHLNPRFDQNALVLNNEQNGSWGSEERHSNPFHKGHNFDMIITIEHDKIRVDVNGRHVCDFRHRASFQEIRRFGVVGDVQIHNIAYIDGGRGGHDHGTLQVPGAVALRQGCNAGRMIQIQGTPNQGANRFELNLQSSNGVNPPNIALHLSVRWNDQTGRPCVVRTNCQHGSWGAEERDGHFPFQQGVPFTVLILVEQQEFKIAVNGQHFTSFRHRSPIEAVNHVGVNGDVTIQSINIF